MCLAGFRLHEFAQQSASLIAAPACCSPRAGRAGRRPLPTRITASIWSASATRPGATPAAFMPTCSDPPRAPARQRRSALRPVANDAARRPALRADHQRQLTQERHAVGGALQVEPCGRRGVLPALLPHHRLQPGAGGHGRRPCGLSLVQPPQAGLRQRAVQGSDRAGPRSRGAAAAAWQAAKGGGLRGGKRIGTVALNLIPPWPWAGCRTRLAICAV